MNVVTRPQNVPTVRIEHSVREHGACQLVVLSAKTETALRAAIANLQHWLSDPKNIAKAAKSEDAPTLLGSIAFTLLTGRELFPHRVALVVSSLAALQAGLGHTLNNLDTHRVERPDQGREVAFLCQDPANAVATGQGLSLAQARSLYGNEPAFRAAVDRCLALMREGPGPGHAGSEEFRAFVAPHEAQGDLPTWPSRTRLLDWVLSYASALLWKQWGVQPSAVIAPERTHRLALHLAGALSFEDAFGAELRAEPAPAQAVTPAIPLLKDPAVVREEGVLALDLRRGCLAGTGGAGHGLPVFLAPQSEASDGQSHLMVGLAGLTLAGARIDWHAHFADKPVRRLSLPSYAFDRHRHWLTMARPEASRSEPWGPSTPENRPSTVPQSPKEKTGPAVDQAGDLELAGIEQTLCRMCEALLGVERIDPADNVIALGMDSLTMIKLSKQIGSQFGVQITPHHLFTRPTLASLAEKIRAAHPTKAAPPLELSPASPDLPAERLLDYVASLSDAEVDRMLAQLGHKGDIS
ncbi:MAG: phosphopantetheine-binding protein [Rhodospirillaceae bacterium]